MQKDVDFPFLTMGLYEANAHHAREQSGAEVISFYPIVSNANRLKWEKYSVDNQDWIQDSRKIIAQGDDHSGTSEYLDKPIAPFIHFHDEQGADVRSSALNEVII